MIDDTTVSAVAAFDRDDMPGVEIASGDFICRNFEVLAVACHRRNSSCPMFRFCSTLIELGRARQSRASPEVIVDEDTPDETASAADRARPAAPGAPRKLFPMSSNEVAQHIAIALAVIRPPIQIGRGRKLPDQSDRDRREAAKAIVEHAERCGIKWFIRQPGPWHSS
jgi:hypothetical protein